MASVLANRMVALATKINNADCVFEAENNATWKLQMENTMVSPQKASSLEVGDYLALGEIKQGL